MPVNRNALIRYKTIDKCLQNHFRKWTLEDLIDACSDALYEYEGIDKGVSKRTVQADIQMMRSDKLGYNAPIAVTEKKYYVYQDLQYSITNILSYLDELYQAILNKRVLRMSYQSFKAKLPTEFLFHAYLLKEFNNRWFVLGVKDESDRLMTLALDRIEGIETDDTTRYITNDDFDPQAYYEHTIGVTVNEGTKVQTVEIFISSHDAPYVLTKPLHHSQEVVEMTDEGTTIRIKVIPNYELERLILGFGEGMEVLKPKRLRTRIKKKLMSGLENYEEE